MKKLSYVLSFVFMLATVFVIVGCSASVSAADDTYVTIDINPSIELIVSPREKVLYANPLNEDGELLLANLDLIGLPLEEAIDLIIAESISLGFIDVDSEETIVSVSTISGNFEVGETIRERVKESVNNAFMKRAMMGKAEDKGFTPEFLAEAESYGVTPGFLALVKSVVAVDDTILFEDALLMTQQDLMDILHDAREANREVAQALRDEFFAARQLIFDEYLPQIQALEAQIAAAAEDEDTTDLQAQLDALKVEFKAELTALRDTFHAESEGLKAQIMEQRQLRFMEYSQKVQEYMNQVQSRKDQMQDEIEEFQGKRP